MFDPVSYILGVATGVATGVTAAIAIEMLYDRWRRRRPSDLAELQRHQALPPAVKQPAATGATIRLDQTDIIRPARPDLHYHGDVLRVVATRRRRPQ